MTYHSITVTAYHADGTICPSEHRHTTSGSPLNEGCTGRKRFPATCSCKQWTSGRSSTKSYAPRRADATASTSSRRNPHHRRRALP